MKRKTISIRKDQAEWLDEHHINLSSFMREAIDDLIEKYE